MKVGRGVITSVSNSIASTPMSNTAARKRDRALSGLNARYGGQPIDATTCIRNDRSHVRHFNAGHFVTKALSLRNGVDGTHFVHAGDR